MEKACQSRKQTERMGRVRRHGMLRGNKWMLAPAVQACASYGAAAHNSLTVHTLHQY